MPPPTEGEDGPHTSKSVTFIPMSPRSAAALRRHHEEQKAAAAAAKAAKEKDRDDDEAEDQDIPDLTLQDYITALIGGGTTKPTSSKSRSRSHPRSRHDSPSSSEEEIELLPPRFDAQGRPLHSSPSRQNPQWTHRKGDFSYSSPSSARQQRNNVSGEWAVGGTDPEAVERMVRGVTGVLEGVGTGKGGGGGGLLGVLGGLLLKGVVGGLAGAGGGGAIEGRRGDNGGTEKVRVRRDDGRRTRSVGERRNRREREEEEEEDDDYFYDRERRRRRWR